MSFLPAVKKDTIFGADETKLSPSYFVMSPYISKQRLASKERHHFLPVFWPFLPPCPPPPEKKDVIISQFSLPSLDNLLIIKNVCLNMERIPEEIIYSLNFTSVFDLKMQEKERNPKNLPRIIHSTFFNTRSFFHQKFVILKFISLFCLE